MSNIPHDSGVAMADTVLKDMGDGTYSPTVAIKNFHPVELMIFQYLDTVGNGTGTTIAIGDYSTVAQDFKLTAQAGFNSHLSRMIVHIRDSGAFSAEKYGAVATLTNGIEILVIDSEGATILDLSSGDEITSVAHWERHAHDLAYNEIGAGDKFYSVRWTFTKAGFPICLKPGQSFVARLSDDLTGLIDHAFFMQGYQVPIV